MTYSKIKPKQILDSENSNDLTKHKSEYFPSSLTELRDDYTKTIEMGNNSLFALQSKLDSLIEKDKKEHKKKYNCLKRLFNKSLRKPQQSYATKQTNELKGFLENIQEKRKKIAKGLEEIIWQGENQRLYIEKKIELEERLKEYQKGFEKFDEIYNSITDVVQILQAHPISNEEAESAYQIMSQLNPNTPENIKDLLTNYNTRMRLVTQYKFSLEEAQKKKTEALFITETKAQEFQMVCEQIEDIRKKSKVLLALYNPAITKLKHHEHLFELIENKSRSNEAIEGLKSITDDNEEGYQLTEKKEQLDAEFSIIESEIETDIELQNDLNYIKDSLIDSAKPCASISRVLKNKKSEKEELEKIHKELEEEAMINV